MSAVLPQVHDGFRPEIQGLRAIAVLIVLVFHLWPAALPGGYVGVDVFFVISGYLITGLLLRQAERNGRISITDFYAKRIKRLLPAATLVLFTVATCISILPVLRWTDTANEIAASALYFENWWLAAKSVDYLAAENAPSPLQHFWSLSVEEQYYIVWPLVFGLLAAAGTVRRFGARKVFGLIVVAVGVVSLSYSVFITPRDPGLAYFATTTRAWELALGGAVAVFTRWEELSERVRQWMGFLGLVLIFAAAWFFDSSTPFPGYLALIPTVGAAFMIVSGASSRGFSVYGMLRSGPFQYVGDLSYSLYLWHWPAVIFYKQIAGRDLGLVDGLIVGMVSLALAHQTKVLVEDRFRRPAFASASKLRPFLFGLGCILLTLWCWAAISHQVSRLSASESAIDHAQASAYPGAMSLSDALVVPAGFDPFPSALAAREDRGDPYRDRCITSLLGTDIRKCEYGSPKAKLHLVLVGDSHAVHWAPTLQVIADHNDARLTVITKSACAVADVQGVELKLDQHRACVEWSRLVIDQLLGLKPDAVLFAHSHNSMGRLLATKEESGRLLADSFAKLWSRLEEQGIAVYAIRDTPAFRGDVPECLAGSPEDPAACGRPRSEALPTVDPLVMAVKRLPSTKLLDLSDAICGPETCDAVVGNIVAWRDAHHMTQTFAHTLAPALSRQMAPVVQEVPVAIAFPMSGNPSVAASGLPSDCGINCLGVLRPALVRARDDVPAAYASGCHADQTTDEPKACTMGEADAPKRMFVVGDSHAAQWLPAYERFSARTGWRVESYTKSACAFMDAEVIGGTTRDRYESCTRWNRNFLDQVKRERPDILLVSQSVAYRVVGLDADDAEANFDAIVDGLEARWREVGEAGVQVIVLADTPRLGIDVPECLAAAGATLLGCSRPSAGILSRPDPLRVAAERLGVHVVDLNDRICPGDTCPPVIGDVLVWRDSHHVSATFAAELGDTLVTRLQKAYGQDADKERQPRS